MVNTTDTAQHVGKELNDMTAEEEDEYIEQLAAQISCLAVKIPEAIIMEACKKAYVLLLVPPKSKYEYNNERKRDVKVCKAKVEVVAAVSAAIEQSNQSVYGQLYADPSLYVRHYQLKSYKKLIKDLDPRYTTFERVQKIDLGDQQIGDQGLEALCNGLRSSPVEVISLINCDISDDGLCNSFSGLMRSLFELKELYLNQNKFGDRGIESLFRDDTYSRSLRLINISRNTFTSKAALYVGSMFVVPVQAEPPAVAPDAAGGGVAPTTTNVQAAMAAAVSAVGEDPASTFGQPPPPPPAPVEKGVRVCKLEAVFAGGIMTNRNGGEGDKFVRTLCGQLMTPNARPIKELHVPDMALSDSGGLRSLAALIAISPGLRTVNITRNAITTQTTKTFFYLALMLNKDLHNLMMGQCGLEYSDLKSFELLKRKNRQLRGKQEEMERRAAGIADIESQTGSGNSDRYRLQSISESVAGAASGAEGAITHSHPVVKVGNVLTWHEKVTGGLMIAKEASTNEQIRYRLNLEIYNMWKAIKPIETPVRIAAPYEAYKEIMQSRRLSSDPLAYLIKPMKHLDTGSKPGTATSRPTSPNRPLSANSGAVVAVSPTGSASGTDGQGQASEEEETPVDNSAEMKYLPQDVEISLRCSLLFSDYITIFLEPDRQVALSFIRTLSEQEIEDYRQQLGVDAADSEDAAAKKKTARLEKARKRASEKGVPQIYSGAVAGSALSTARRGSNSSVGSVRSDSTGASGDSDTANPLQVMIPGDLGTNQFIVPFNMTAVRILGKNELVLSRHMDNYLSLRDAAEKRIEKRTAASAFSRLFMTVCVDKYVTAMKNRSAKNPGKVRASGVSGWASKSSRKTAAMTPGLVSMAIEDYHASLMELSTETEQSMARIHQAFIGCIDGSKTPAKTVKAKKPSMRGSSIKVKSDAGILNASNKLAINDLFNYKTLDLAGYYIACVCHSVPRERERAIEAGKKDVEDSKLNEIFKAREEAKTAKKATTFKMGPRFMIYTPKRPRPVETEDDRRHFQEINAHHKSLPVAEAEVRNESTKFGLFNAVMSTKTAAFFRRFNEGSEKVAAIGKTDVANAVGVTDDSTCAGAIAIVGSGAVAQRDEIPSPSESENVPTPSLIYEVELVQGGAGLGVGIHPGFGSESKGWIVSSTNGLQIQQIDATAGGDINEGDELVRIAGEDCSGWSAVQIASRLDGEHLPTGMSIGLCFSRPADYTPSVHASQDCTLMLGAPDAADGAVAMAEALAAAADPDGTPPVDALHSELDGDTAASGPASDAKSQEEAVPSELVLVPNQNQSENQATELAAPYRSKYFKIPTIYRRPSNNGGYENASTDELHFLCSESLDGLCIAQSRSDRRFLISNHANTIWSRLIVNPKLVLATDDPLTFQAADTGNQMKLTGGEKEEGVSVSVAVAAPAEGAKSRGRTRTSSSFREGSPGAVSAGGARGSFVAPGADASQDPSVYSRVKARTNTSFWFIEPPVGLPSRPGAVVAAPSAPTPAPICYAEVECNRSEPIGSMEHMDIWRLKVLNEERKRLQQERRMKSHEEMLK